MMLRSAVAVLLAVIIAVSAIELSTWALGRAMSVVMPSASVSEVDPPQASEVDAPAPTPAPALTW